MCMLCKHEDQMCMVCKHEDQMRMVCKHKDQMYMLCKYEDQMCMVHKHEDQMCMLCKHEDQSFMPVKAKARHVWWLTCNFSLMKAETGHAWGKLAELAELASSGFSKSYCLSE